ncbi:nagb/rpia/CoA transferase-like protein [Myriangium duriaei CBS 260.36]|uniref:Translation initiation factor eIF2B subunit alpha n=1 Tax=Myriangium duriaei CBS 260.36 TaxID=1168546 RepID=A0A9P4IWI9_9PEZI|nr:nagb/rpia/CoA transferase-like protein [Myriangium duriaei CBS 260.36]
MDSWRGEHSVAAPQSPFDIVSTYNRLLAEDPDLTMPVAAIESLVLALSQHPSTTVSETLNLLTTLTAQLKAGVPNPIALSAGTDLFQRYIITTLQRPATLTSPGPSRSGSLAPGGTEADFDTIRSHLVRNGRLFVERAKEARERIAGFGRHFIRDGHVVLTNGGSRVVGALLRSAAESSRGFGAAGSVRFKVVYVVNSVSALARSEDGKGEGDEGDRESRENIAALRRLGVPVAAIPPTAMAYCLGQVTACFVGAEGVVENGGIISRLGTYQMGMLAKQAGKPFYVVAESHKFVRLYPLGQNDLGIDQKIVDFKTSDDKPGVKVKEDTGTNPLESAVDFTPPHLISGIITESGVLLPSAVSEELIKIWF